MGYPATTITEFYENIGEARGQARGEAYGEARGQALGRIESRIESLQQQIASLKRLHKNGKLDKETLVEELQPLQTELKFLKLKLQGAT